MEEKEVLVLVHGHQMHPAFSEDFTPGTSRSVQSRSPDKHGRSRNRRSNEDRGHGSRKDEHERYTYEQKYTADPGTMGSRNEYASRKTPARSDWDDGRREWEDSPHRDSQNYHSMARRRQHPSPSPMLAGASPDARLVSPWLGGQTPRSAARAFF